jgi:hypothetical protein
LALLEQIEGDKDTLSLSTNQQTPIEITDLKKKAGSFKCERVSYHTKWVRIYYEGAF